MTESDCTPVDGREPRNLAMINPQNGEFGSAPAPAHGRSPVGLARRSAQQPSWRAITICWTSSVPSPIVRILASR